ncbi:MAG: diguanylate cyclase [Pseudomonadota bacterium]
MTEAERITRRMVRTTIAAVAIILLTISGTFAVSSFAVSVHERDATLINYAGRQRTLVQRMTIVAMDVVRLGETASIRASQRRADLRVLMSDFLFVQRALRDGAPSLGIRRIDSADVDAVLLGAPFQLNARIAEFEQAVQRLLAAPADAPDLAALATMQALSNGPLQRGLDRVVQILEIETVASTKRVTKLQTVLMVLGLTAVAATSLLVLRPMIRDVSGTMLRNEALRDALETAERQDKATGLANRTQSLSHLAHALTSANATHRALGAMRVEIADLDGLIERHGVAAADAAVEAVAVRLRRSARRQDYVARIGDDSFLVLTVGARRAVGLEDAANKLNAAMRTPVTIAQGRTAPTTAKQDKTQDPAADAGARDAPAPAPAPAPANAPANAPARASSDAGEATAAGTWGHRLRASLKARGRGETATSPGGEVAEETATASTATGASGTTSYGPPPTCVVSLAIGITVAPPTEMTVDAVFRDSMAAAAEASALLARTAGAAPDGERGGWRSASASAGARTGNAAASSGAGARGQGEGARRANGQAITIWHPRAAAWRTQLAERERDAQRAAEHAMGLETPPRDDATHGRRSP